MMFTEGDRLVITASLQWAAMEHGMKAESFFKAGNRLEAQKFANFSSECSRLADMMKKAK